MIPGEQKINTGQKTGKRAKASFEQGTVFYYVKKLFPDVVFRATEQFEKPPGIDVYIPSRRTGINYDSLYRHRTEEDFKNEVKKYLRCRTEGIVLYRITEEDPREWADTADDVYCVLGGGYKKDLNVVLQYLLDRIDPELNTEQIKDPRLIHSRISVDIEQDREKILECLDTLNEPLPEIRPDLAEQWHPEKNGGLLPGEFGTGSGASVWWKCPRCGYEWEEVISRRGKKKGNSCPECAKHDGKMQIGKLKSTVFRGGR